MRAWLPRSNAPFDSLDDVILQMIEVHAGKPCPRRSDVMGWTGMPRRRVWKYLEGMAARGLIEIEFKARDSGKGPKRRRMRKAGGEWTLWTDRPGRTMARAA